MTGIDRAGGTTTITVQTALENGELTILEFARLMLEVTGSDAPLEHVEAMVDDPQRRVLATTIGDVRIIDLYVPNGSEVGSEKYDYKLGWLRALRDYLATQLEQYDHLVVLGDFNRQLESPGDAVWSEIDDGQPAHIAQPEPLQRRADRLGYGELQADADPPERPHRRGPR